MMVSTTRITVTPGKRKEFLQTINQLLEPIKAAKGCKAFNVYLDTCDENSSLLVTEWDMEAGLNIYLRSDDFAILKTFPGSTMTGSIPQSVAGHTDRYPSAT